MLHPDISKYLGKKAAYGELQDRLSNAIDSSKNGIVKVFGWGASHDMKLDVAVNARDAIKTALEGGSFDAVHDALENTQVSVGVTVNF